MVSESFEKMSRQTKMHLTLLEHSGDLDKSHLEGRILDFGAFIGYNSQALKSFGGDVEAVDVHESIKEIIKEGILSANKVYHQNGIELLRNRPDTYDLICGFLLGPLHDNIFLNEFYEAAKIGLKDTGKILITSDPGSFKYVKKLTDNGYGFIKRYPTFPPIFIGSK